MYELGYLATLSYNNTFTYEKLVFCRFSISPLMFALRGEMSFDDTNWCEVAMTWANDQKENNYYYYAPTQWIFSSHTNISFKDVHRCGDDDVYISIVQWRGWISMDQRVSMWSVAVIAVMCSCGTRRAPALYSA